jgi:peroxiredoxin (alkyl hydroperoxide reductase subunit C)
MATLIGQKAPHFSARAVVNGHIQDAFSLDQYLGKKYVLFFFYPKDFTFVCPTELHAFEAERVAFEERNTQLVACSTDTEFSHWAWLQLAKTQGGIQGVRYPIVADINKTISASYGVLAGRYILQPGGHFAAEGELVAYRGLFLIDKGGVVQHVSINNMPIGRSVEESIRVIDALQHFETHGEVCPSGWKMGEKAMKPNTEGLIEYFAEIP